MSITTFTEYGHDLRDDQSGIAIKNHTAGQRAAYLSRHPEIDGNKLPPVRDDQARPELRPTVINGGGLRFSEPSRAGLLRDPAPMRSVTKPAVEQSLHRTSCHELGHLLISFYNNLPVARITVEPKGNTLGEVFTANRPATFETLTMLVAGRAAERVAYGRADELSGVDLRLARELAGKLAPAQGVTVDRLIELASEAAFEALRGKEGLLMRMAVELRRRKTIDFNDVDEFVQRHIAAFEQRAALDDEWQKKIELARVSASVREYKQQQAAKAAPSAKHGGREFDLSKSKDAAAFSKLFPDIMRTGDGFIRPSCEPRAKR